MSFIHLFEDFDNPTEFEKRNRLRLYPFDVMVITMPNVNLRLLDSEQYIVRNIGANAVHKIFDTNNWKFHFVYFEINFPERWLTPKEQTLFMSKVVERRGILEKLYLITNSPIILSDFTEDYVKSVWFERENKHEKPS